MRAARPNSAWRGKGEVCELAGEGGRALATPTGFEPAISALTGQYVRTTTPRGRATMM